MADSSPRPEAEVHDWPLSEVRLRPIRIRQRSHRSSRVELVLPQWVKTEDRCPSAGLGRSEESAVTELYSLINVEGANQ